MADVLLSGIDTPSTEGYVMCMTQNQGERQTEWIYRPGFGWVERPVERPDVEAEQEDDEPAAAA